MVLKVDYSKTITLIILPTTSSAEFSEVSIFSVLSRRANTSQATARHHILVLVLVVTDNRRTGFYTLVALLMTIIPWFEQCVEIRLQLCRRSN